MTRPRCPRCDSPLDFWRPPSGAPAEHILWTCFGPGSFTDIEFWRRWDALLPEQQQVLQQKAAEGKL